MREDKYSSPSVSEQIQRYYRANHVNIFTYSRPFHRGQKDPSNEFATLCIEKTTLHTTYSLPGIIKNIYLYILTFFYFSVKSKNHLVFPYIVFSITFLHLTYYYEFLQEF